MGIYSLTTPDLSCTIEPWKLYQMQAHSLQLRSTRLIVIGLLKTSGFSIVSPEILPYEIGNALVTVRRKGRLTDREVLRAFESSQKIAVRLLPVRVHDAMKMAIRFNIYAYDAYYLQCCIENKLSLISLDDRMYDVARSLLTLRDRARININRYKQPSSSIISFRKFRLTNFHKICILQSSIGKSNQLSGGR